MVAPKLRFKEFDGDYLELKYDKFAPLQRGFDLPVSTIVDGDFPVVFSNGILKKHNEFKAKAPGVVTGRSGTIGNITWVEKDYWPHNTSLWVTNFFGNEPKYIFYFLQEFDVSRFASGSGVPTLNRNDVHAQLINIPNNKEEQTKIAAFLSAVDEKISQLTQKHALLSQYKQGMMQKLFSQQIRFKADDGSEFGEWEERKLSEISQKAMYGMNAAATEYDGINKYLRITDICEFSNSFKKDNLTSPNAELFDRYKLQLGDLLFARTGASVGKSYLYREDDGITYFAGFLIRFSLNTNLVIPYFIFLQTLIKEFCQWVVTNSMRSGQPGINAEEYSSYIFKVPCLEEQTKIANFLSSIDQKIEVVAQQIEQAKQWKKGLLQQMFV